MLYDPSGDAVCGGEYDGESLAETIENAVAHARAADAGIYG